MKKLKTKRWILLFVLVVLVVVGIQVVYKNQKQDEVVMVSSIDDYGYTLESNETRIYKKYFKELKEELSDNEIDEEHYAKLVTQLFLIDFYTLNNKITNQDVGGLQFLNTNIKDNFYDKAVNTIYKYVKSNIYGTRHQSLPEVKDVEIVKIENTSYKEGDLVDENAFQIETKITYKKDLDYPEQVKAILIHENNKLTVIEISEI